MIARIIVSGDLYVVIYVLVELSALNDNGCLRRAVGESRYRLGAQQADAVLQGGVGRTVLVDGCHVEGDDACRLVYLDQIAAGRRAGDGDAVVAQVHGLTVQMPGGSVVGELIVALLDFAHHGDEGILIDGRSRDAAAHAGIDRGLLHDLDLCLTRRHHRVGQAHAVEHPQLLEAQPPGRVVLPVNRPRDGKQGDVGLILSFLVGEECDHICY